MPPSILLETPELALALALFLLPVGYAIARGSSIRTHSAVSRGILIAISLAGLALGVNWAAGTAWRLAVRFLALAEQQNLLIAHQRREAILAQPRYREPKRLSMYEARVFSQNGEDGAIAEIFRRIGTTNQYFVDFGSSDGMQNNTVFLLKNGWRGLWIDGDQASVESARSYFAYEVSKARLTITQAFITAENIEELFRDADVPSEFDLLSVDIDRNDYYVWEAIRSFSPRVAIVEYNAAIPQAADWTVEYDSDRWWDGTVNYGASLRALERLGREKGYSLVGCDVAGINAFFVRNDLLGDHFAAPFTTDNHYEPARYSLTLPFDGHIRRPERVPVEAAK